MESLRFCIALVELVHMAQCPVPLAACPVELKKRIVRTIVEEVVVDEA